MLRYTLRRLSWLPIILFGVSLLAFILLRTLPGQDPAAVIAGQFAKPEQLERIRQDLGLERPVFPVSFSREGLLPVPEFHANSQYRDWITDLLTGDLGREFRSEKPIKDEFARRFIPSLQILVMSLIVSAVVGIGLGILSALYRNSILDYIVRLFAVLAASIPEFFLLTLLIIIPSYLWRYSQPIGGYEPLWENPSHNIRLFGPAALIIGIGGAAGLMRLTRTTMLEILRADYVRTAQAKGLRKYTVVVSHAFRNSLTPIVTALGTAFVGILGGSIIAERILSIDGLGSWFFTAAFSRDLPVVQFLVVYTAFIVVLVNLVVDLSYAWIDPRVKYS
jgi:peptide/nickel transport system permease protein